MIVGCDLSIMNRLAFPVTFFLDTVGRGYMFPSALCVRSENLWYGCTKLGKNYLLARLPRQLLVASDNPAY